MLLQETQAIISDMRTVSARLETERERQMARVKQMKEKKLARREERLDQAQSILETAEDADVVCVRRMR